MSQRHIIVGDQSAKVTDLARKLRAVIEREPDVGIQAAAIGLMTAGAALTSRAPEGFMVTVGEHLTQAGRAWNDAEQRRQAEALSGKPGGFG